MKKRQRKDFGPLPEVGFIRVDHVLHLLGIAKTTLYEGMANGIFPKPHKLTSRTSVWAVDEIRAFIDKVKSGENQQEAQQ